MESIPVLMGPVSPFHSRFDLAICVIVGISRSFGFSARYSWEYEPGNEIFFSIGHGAVIPGTRFEKFLNKTTQATLRVGHTFRF